MSLPESLVTALGIAAAALHLAGWISTGTVTPWLVVTAVGAAGYALVLACGQLFRLSDRVTAPADGWVRR